MTLPIEGDGYVEDKVREGKSIKVRWRRRTKRTRWAFVTPANKAQNASRLRPRWLEQIYADPGCTVRIAEADEPNEKGIWLASNGRLVRVATKLEVTHGTIQESLAYGDGMWLVDAASFVETRRERVESPEDRERQRVERVRQRHERRIEHARKYLARAEAVLEAAQARADSWYKELRAALSAQERFAEKQKGGAS